MSDSLRPHGLSPARLLCPWNFPGKNAGVGFHFLLQENLYCEALSTNVTVFWNRIFKDLIKVKWGHMEWNSNPIGLIKIRRGDTRRVHKLSTQTEERSCNNTVRSHLSAGQRVFIKILFFLVLGLGFPISRNFREKKKYIV